MRLRPARALGAAPPAAPRAARRPPSAAPRAAPPGADPAAAPAAAPPPAAYADSATDIAFINACRVTYGRLAGWQSPRAWDSGPETVRAQRRSLLPALDGSINAPRLDRRRRRRRRRRSTREWSRSRAR